MLGFLGTAFYSITFCSNHPSAIFSKCGHFGRHPSTKVIPTFLMNVFHLRTTGGLSRVEEGSEELDPDTSNSMEQGQRRKNEQAQVEILSKNHRRMTFCMRALTFSLLIGVAITLSILVYRYVADEQNDRYDEAFDEQAVKLLEVLETRLDERVRAIEFFALSVMSNLISQENTNWTELYVPHMEIRGNRTNDLADAFSLTLIPIIQADQRSAWESFSVENQGWRDEGLAFQQKWIDESWQEPVNWKNQHGYIHESITEYKDGMVVKDEGNGPFLPSWQTAPALADPDMVNLNLLKHPAYEKVLTASMEKGRLILGDTSLPFENATESAKHSFLRQYIDHWSMMEGKEYHGDPVTDLVYPIHVRKN